MRSKIGTRGTSALVFAAAAAVVSLAACGGDGGGSSTAAANASATGGSATAFRDCLEKHGVDLPDDIGQGGPGLAQPPTNGQPPAVGDGGGPGFGNNAKFREALNACRDKAPQGRVGGARNPQAFQAYGSCLRDHGVNVPDPSTSTSTPTGRSTPPTSFDRNDPNFAAANQVCQPLLPTPSSTTSTVKS